MNRFLKVMIVLLAIAAFAAPAMATDFSVSGQARVEGYYNDLDSDLDSADDPSSWFEQRVRLDNRFQVSDEVLVRIRFDFEGTWGWTGQDTMRNMPHTGAQTDYAYIQLNKEMFSLTAGQAYFGSSNAILVNHIGTGLSLTLKTPVSVKLMYTKYDENGSKFDDDVAVAAGGSYVDADEDPTTAPVWTPTAATTANAEDEDFYGVEVAYKGDGFGVSGVYAVLDNKATDANRSGFGVAANFNLAAFAVKAELDFLDGDNGGSTDYVGTQLYLDANTSVSEAFNVGAWLWYMMGTDDANEQVISNISNWDTFNPLWGGYVGQAVVAADPITSWGPEDYDGNPNTGVTSNAGLIAGALYATFNVSDDLGLKFQGAYLMEEEDAVRDFDIVSLTGSAKYKLATNTYLMGDVIYSDLSSDSDGDDDSISLWTQLQVNF